MTDHQQTARRFSSGRWRRLRSLRVRLIAVFAAVALLAAVSASGIAYWLNRDAVLKRAQDTALNDFRVSLSRNVSDLPLNASCPELAALASTVASSGLTYDVVVVDGAHPECPASSDPTHFTLADVPAALQSTVAKPREVTESNPYPYHLYWQRQNLQGRPFVIGGTKVLPNGPTAYMFKSLENERADLNTLGWSLAIATLLALIGSALLAQAASATVLRPVKRLGEAAKRLGEGHLDTRLEVEGSDELADLARTFNRAAESLHEQVEELSAREAQSRRFVADMSHELRTPLTAMTAVTDILEDEAESLDPMIEPAVRLVVSETRRLSDLVENLMEVTRFDAGTAKLVADEVDVADLIMSCIDGRAWYDAVELDAPRGILAVVDPRRLDVVFANLIGNALLRLLTDARYAGSLFGGAMTAHQAIDEVLWHEPPMANLSAHYPRYDITFHGREIKAGSLVLVSYAAANSQAAPPTEGGELRSGESAHLAWAAGPHACPARDPALLIAITAIEQLTSRLSDLELATPAGELLWRPGPFHRALVHLPVRFAPLAG